MKSWRRLPVIRAWRVGPGPGEALGLAYAGAAGLAMIGVILVVLFTPARQVIEQVLAVPFGPIFSGEAGTLQSQGARQPTVVADVAVGAVPEAAAESPVPTATSSPVPPPATEPALDDTPVDDEVAPATDEVPPANVLPALPAAPVIVVPTPRVALASTATTEPLAVSIPPPPPNVPVTATVTHTPTPRPAPTSTSAPATATELVPTATPIVFTPTSVPTTSTPPTPTAIPALSAFVSSPTAIAAAEGPLDLVRTELPILPSLLPSVATVPLIPSATRTPRATVLPLVPTIERRQLPIQVPVQAPVPPLRLLTMLPLHPGDLP
ncbi:MAG: hypothetical protein QOF51_1265 [Chloroflexota bacterium]|jgi:hypothetical protein|nr:hypothetical protein [Chloroflexota bacterium]